MEIDVNSFCPDNCPYSNLYLVEETERCADNALKRRVKYICKNSELCSTMYELGQRKANELKRE